MSWPMSALVFLALCLVQINCYKHQTASEHHAPYHFDPYSYGYDVEDNYGNKQWRQEKSSNPMEVHGSYGYRDSNGLYREVSYVADKNGFRANVKSNEPGIAGTKDPASVKLDTYHSPTPSKVDVAAIQAGTNKQSKIDFSSQAWPVHQAAHNNKHVSSSGVPIYYKTQQVLQ